MRLFNNRIAEHPGLAGHKRLASWFILHSNEGQGVSKQNRWAVTYATLLNNLVRW